MLELCWDEAFAVLGHPQQSLLGQRVPPLAVPPLPPSVCPAGCRRSPRAVALCSQQSSVPAGARLGGSALGCCGAQRLTPSLLPPVAADTYDEVAQYLDHLLQRTVPQANLPPTAQRGGLSRFRAAVHTTRDLMSLASKAKDLHVQSE